MSRFPVSPSKAEDLRRRMESVGLAERDFVERFYSPNHGKHRKRGSQVAVHLKHEPSNLEVRCFRSTSQALNRFLARRMLVRMLEKRTGSPKKEPLSTERTATVVETATQHMQRMFTQSFEKDIAQPYPLPSQKLLGVGSLPAKLIGIMGEREAPLQGKRPSSS